MVAEARSLAERVHEGQRRKADGRPYFEHVCRVAETVSDAGFDPEVVTAALLHDVVEHTEIEAGQIEPDFGTRVAELVAAMTDREEIEPWEALKAEHRARVSVAGRDACAIYAADKLEGIREARSGYAEIGEAVEERLGNTVDARIAVWNADLAMIDALQPPLPFAATLHGELKGLLSDRAGDRQTSGAS
jgi:(p)ppGpp synthase/HD superfamily hydrolase